MIEGVYMIEIVGGPYDGAPGFSWLATDEVPLPQSLAVGVCPGHGECNSATACTRGRHVAFWHTEFEDPPVATIIYVLQEDLLEAPHELHPNGKAVYAIGGLDSLARLEEREMVPAGAVGGVCYG